MLERYITERMIRKAISPFALTKKPERFLILSVISSAIAAIFYTIDQPLRAALFIALNIHTMLIATEISGKDKDRPKNIDLIHNHNRLSDAFIYTGIAASPHVPAWLGILALSSAILLPHLGYRIRAFTNAKKPPITRLDTTAVVLISTLASPIVPQALIIGAISVIILNMISLATTIFSKNHP